MNVYIVIEEVETLFKYTPHAVLGYTPTIILSIVFCTVINVLKERERET
jgi:hypothetical protein